MRTIQRDTLPLNKEKHEDLETLCRAYSNEKRHWLGVLQSWDFQAQLGTPRKIRDFFVQNGYQSHYGLQARHWKLALQDAIETWDAYWKAVYTKARSKIYKYTSNEEESHYAYWLLSGFGQFSSLMQGKIPKPDFPVEKATCRKIACFVRKTIKKLKTRPPVVKRGRIVTFDANCYRTFENNGRQYLSLMSLKKGKRLLIPLKGITKIQGNLSIVLKNDVFTIHVTEKLKTDPLPKVETIEAVDFGFTEVMTDTKGNRYGKNLGRLLTTGSDALNEKMKKRHRLHALEKKYRITNPEKAKRLRKYNLGRHKLSFTMDRTKAAIECEINTGINDLFRTSHCTVLVTEDLRHGFSFNGPKTVNRRLSFWVKGTIQDRIAFKALAEGFRHEQVNPAYGSQTCPLCGFVDEKNRSKDLFMCLHCGHEDLVDRVAALNYARRYDDQEIERYTPYRKVQTILLGRFHRRLEAEQSATVPGRTLETVQSGCPPHFVEVIAIAGREKFYFHPGGHSESETNEYV